jgi:mRNA-degrading endonuclease YafQ of YafQ-DinJ toxin-antitoxin module
MREIFQQSPFKADFKRVSRSGRYKAEDVLIYQKPDDDRLVLARLGSHSELGL